MSILREHFISSVSMNDINWEQLQIFDKTHNFCESELYPLEWLFVTGDKKRGISILERLDDIIQTPQDLVLFIWKLHNTVSSSVTNHKDCTTEEYYDDEIYGCGAGRIWPFAKRWEFKLINGVEQWNKIRDTPKIRNAIRNLYDLDKNNDILRRYWVEDDIGNIGDKLLKDVLVNIKALDDGMIESGIFAAEYSVGDIIEFNMSEYVVISEILLQRDINDISVSNGLEQVFLDECMDDEDDACLWLIIGLPVTCIILLFIMIFVILLRIAKKNILNAEIKYCNDTVNTQTIVTEQY